MPRPAPGEFGCAGFRASMRSRREVIRIGGLAGVGLLAPRPAPRPRRVAREPSGRPELRAGPVGHHDLPPRRAGAAGDLGPEALRAVARARRVRRDRHGRAGGRPSASCCRSRPGSWARSRSIRSLTHPNANHVQAALPAMTGHHHPPGTESRGDFPPSATDFPAVGAVLDHLRGVGPAADLGPGRPDHDPEQRHGAPRPVARVPRRGPRPAAHRPGPDARRRPGRGRRPRPVRHARRGSAGGGRCWNGSTTQRRALDRAAAVRTLDAHQGRALDLLTAPAVARAFDLGGRAGRGRATPTAATRSASPACWPAGWPRPACR